MGNQIQSLPIGIPKPGEDYTFAHKSLLRSHEEACLQYDTNGNPDVESANLEEEWNFMNIDDNSGEVDITAINRLSRPVYVSYEEMHAQELERGSFGTSGERPAIRVTRDRQQPSSTSPVSLGTKYHTLPRSKYRIENPDVSDTSPVGEKLPFASPFFLKPTSSEKYIRCGDSSSNVCVVKPQLDVSSLLTFHSRKGNQKNFKGESPENLQFVENGDIVTIYSNVAGGKYLSPVRPKYSVSSVRWNGDYSEVKKGGEEFEFIVHRVPKEDLVAQTSSRKNSLFSTFRKSTGKRTSAMGSQDGTRKRSQPSIVKKYLNSINGNKHTSKHRLGRHSQFAGQCLEIDSVIVLESKLKPGYFIKAMNSSSLVQLSQADPTKFNIVAPELRHLLSLSSAKVETRMISPRQVERKEEVMNESEKEWLRLLQKLPKDIVYTILQYQGNWVKIARLVCRDWRSAAELHVTGVRVNGEFDSFHTEERRETLFSFINRCKYIQSVNLRNVDDVHDEDLKTLRMSTHLRKAMFGGCFNLTDKTIKLLSPLKHLTHINLAMTQVTDSGLFLMAKNLPNLVHINLYGCKNITGRGVLNLILRLKKLEDLNIRGTNVDFIHPRHLEQGVSVLTGPQNPEGIYS